MSPDSKEQPNMARIPPRREGYGLLGRLMGEAPEAAIFRSFAALSAEDLLYRQAELISLEKDWRETQERLRESSNEATQDRIYNWDEIQHSENLTAVLKIREKVDNYHKALLRHREVTRLASPQRSTLRFLQEWMHRETMGNIWFTGVDKDVWSPEPDSKHDLVCVDDTGPWITQYLVLLYHDILGRHVHRSDPERVPHLRNSVSYDNSTISRMAKVFTTVAGALFPVVSIVILYAIDDTKKRLGVLAVVTVLFSLCMSLGTRAGVAEVFGASAAFAAVLVVFIGTSDSSASSTGPVSMNSTTS
ncbi:hypothetical protein V8F06_009137 [Rhypophila decipiens]